MYVKIIMLYAFLFQPLIGCGSKEEYKPKPNIKSGIYKTSIQFANTKNWEYDATYYVIPYPNGDVPSGGVCTDVVIRVLRENGMDLQELIHKDMTAHFDKYPNKWGLTAPDKNIDHRRVPNIMRYFERMGYARPITKDINDYKVGDIICWSLSENKTHIGIYLGNGDIYHNIGPKAMIHNGFMFNYKIIGHYNLNK